VSVIGRLAAASEKGSRPSAARLVDRQNPFRRVARKNRFLPLRIDRRFGAERKFEIGRVKFLREDRVSAVALGLSVMQIPFLVSPRDGH
jgi:hypothetical protein